MQIWGPEVAMVMLLVVGALGVDPLTTTTNSMAGRGEKKFGDKCVETKECGVENSFCDEGSKQCQCLPEFSVTNHYDKCGTVAEVGADCFFNEQCEAVLVPTECRDRKCTCKYELEAVKQPDGTFICKTPYVPTEETYVDPAMILVLVVMALMFIIICVVLHLFSKARWRENRTIFNTPNPRLMNVSLLNKVDKPKHTTPTTPGAPERRNSKGSPSRQPSCASFSAKALASAELRNHHAHHPPQQRISQHSATDSPAPTPTQEKNPMVTVEIQSNA
ncbi:uncharacterized protein LOC103514133 [Diaphorina citri]|uniref:Uncharacterized protein LOC103514133 n=1 Tax=Diaphorina citri TaxID=121845 RepID=A0A3Q0J8D8_DIACI|nr:uncharacterized protein LOC103514133 [Diaphorina citri]